MRQGLLIFDCDGVLIDSEALACRVVAEELAEHGIALAPEELDERFPGFTDQRIAQILTAETGRSLPDDFPLRVAKRTIALFEQELEAVPGVQALLAGLNGPRCVASNSLEERLRFSLRCTDLLRFFAGEAVFSSEMVARGKPAPDLHLHAAAVMGFAPGDCLVIEDSVTGVTAARAAGMEVIGFTGASHVGAGHGDALMAAGSREIADSMNDLARLLSA